jgi:hypothetical protein
MNETRNVLLVTNSITEAEVLAIKNAVDAQADLSIKINLVHVIPTLPTCYFNIPSTVLLAEQYYEEAEKALSAIGNILDIKKDNQWLITGRIKSEVLRLTHQLGAQFILASSINIPELHKSLHHYKDRNVSVIHNLNSLASV